MGLSVGYVLMVYGLVGLLGGCAGSLERTVDRAEVALVGLDVVIENASPAWRAYVEARVEECMARDLATREEGVECLGPAAKAREVEEALEKITKGQAATLEALEALREIAPLLEAAKGAK